MSTVSNPHAVDDPNPDGAEDRTNQAKDPILGRPAHPLAAGIGAVVLGGASGAAVGSAAGPIGTFIGAAIGAIGGALGGDAIASSFDQAAEDSHWRDHYAKQPYVPQDARYEDYGPAYRYGAVSYTRMAGSDFDEVESELSGGWESARGESALKWDQAKHPARDAWKRLHGGELPKYEEAV